MNCTCSGPGGVNGHEPHCGTEQPDDNAAELQHENRLLSARVLEWQAEAERNHGRAENLRQDLIAALRERDTYVDLYRTAAGLRPIERA